MEYKIDREGRVSLPEGLCALSIGNGVRKIVWAQEEQRVFRLISADSIPDDVRVITGELNITAEGRIFIPMVLRKKFAEVKTVQIYVKAKKLYIEF